MCLYSRIIPNKRYVKNQKNGGIIPPVFDERALYVPSKCGKCIECKKQKAREWNVRLAEDIKHNTKGRFITLTFSNESIKELAEDINAEGYELDNAIATKGVRLFMERWRKKYKKSLRHWLITEIGHEGTENIHLHGIVWSDISLDEVERIWKYGYVWKGKGDNKQNYVNEATVNYITKYVTKIDEKHKNFKGKVLTSAGIGSAYTKTYNASKNKYEPGETNELYKNRQGYKIAMPIYWRNKIYSEKEREKLWLEKLDKGERYVLGVKVLTDERYYNELKTARERNKELGYGNDEKNWSEEQYEKEKRNIMIRKRINNAKEKERKKNVKNRSV